MYEVVKIGEQIWMAENLNFYTPSDSWYYDNDGASYEETYGRLYTYQAASNSCPSGWHLPTDNEWKTLESNIGISDNELNNLYEWRGTNQGDSLKSNFSWSTCNQGTNSFGFSALPAGYRGYVSGFLQLGDKATFWVDSYADGSHLVRTFMDCNSGIHRSVSSDANGLSVRCIKE